jgi:hypothetical protein
MHRRHYFLWFAVGCLMYAFVFFRPHIFISYVNYGGTDIWAATSLAIASALCWLTLKVVAHRNAARPIVCSCGYSLKGLRCPWCGKPLG